MFQMIQREMVENLGIGRYWKIGGFFGRNLGVHPNLGIEILGF